MTVDDDRAHGQRPEPQPPRHVLPVAFVTAVITAGGVITVQLVWPWTASALHDGVTLFHAILAALLAVRRRAR